LDTEIRSEMQAARIPSVAACIVEDEAVVWANAYGLADRERGTPASTDTSYMLASVSKLVVVTAVMQLAERGLLDIDEDINRYLPFPVTNPAFPSQRITMRMLLTHTSGLAGPQTDDELPGFYDWFPVDSAPVLYETVRDYLLPGGSAYVPPVWRDAAPGERELYSNLGVTLAAHVVEIVSGGDFNTYCRNHIFLPLEMPGTSYEFRDLGPATIASLYLENSSPIPHYSRRDYPGGQLKSSVGELARFLIAYMNGGEYRGRRILRENTIGEILSIHNPASGRCLIWKRTIGGWYGHSGGVNGATSYVEFHREDRVGLIVLSNVFIEEGSPLQAPVGRIYGLIREESNRYH
jgi:CubicO group peptidase (beta-lactamase class C family)